MKKVIQVSNGLFLALALLLSLSCSPRSSENLDRDFSLGHNGILWGENSYEAAAWLQGSKQIPVKIIREANPTLLKQSRSVREKFLRKLKLRAVPDIDDSVSVAYLFTGLQYVMNFDTQNRFCAVTFGPVRPVAPLTPSEKPAETQAEFQKHVLNRLISKYGKPRMLSVRDKEAEKRYWVWKGKKVDYVLEFIFVKKKSDIPAHWQYSESVLVSHPKYLK